MGAGARLVLPRREGLAVPRPRGAPRSVSVQFRTQEGRARRGAVWQGEMDLRRPRPLAPAAGRHRWRVSAARQPDFPRKATAESAERAEIMQGPGVLGPRLR